MLGRSVAMLILGVSIASAVARPVGPRPPAAPPPHGVQEIVPPGPQNLARPDNGTPPSPGNVFCPGGDVVFANDNAQEAPAGARPYPCDGTLYVVVCHGPVGQYGVFLHEIAPGRHREVETPAGSSFEAQCGAPPARQCPARYCIGGQ